MFVHSVYFWLRADLTPEQRDTFEAGLQSLKAIPDVHTGYVGTPAATDRPIIDRSYSHALIAVFEDRQAHDAYQVHPDHDRFRSDCAGFWSDIRIYDCETPWSN